MGANDHFFDTPDEVVVCSNCHKQFSYWTEDQVPGFRDKDYLICPYCHAELSSSMDIEFHVRKPADLK